MRGVPLILIYVISAFSCREETSISPTWEQSKLSAGVDWVSKFELDDKGNLCARGLIGGKYGIHKLVDGNWSTLLETPSQYDFAVFAGSVYFISGGFVFKSQGTGNNKIPNISKAITLESDFSQVVISADSIIINGTNYTMASFDGTNLTPLPTNSTYRLRKLDQTIYLSGPRNFKLTGNSMQEIGFKGYIDAIDEGGTIYQLNYPGPGNKTAFVKIVNGKDSVQTNTINYNVRGLFRCSAVNAEYITASVDKSSIHILKNKLLIPMNSSFGVIDFIWFNNSLLAASMDGGIYELRNQ